MTCYNETKYGVDIVDEMARKYSGKARARRWPVHTFYNLLDLAGINAWIIYREVTKDKITRREFLLKLAEELTKEYVEIKVKASAAHVKPSEIGDSRYRCRCENRVKKEKVLINVCHVISKYARNVLL